MSRARGSPERTGNRCPYEIAVGEYGVMVIVMPLNDLGSSQQGGIGPVSVTRQMASMRVKGTNESKSLHPATGCAKIIS